MKKVILTFVFILFITVSHAQIFNWGIKGGLNFNSNGNIKSDIEAIPKIFSSNRETGFHIGVMGEMNLPLWFYLRPELYYSQTKSSYSEEGYKTDLVLNRIDAPVLLGLKFLKIGRIFVGPAFHYNINTNLTVFEQFDELKKSSSDDFMVSAQFGIGLEIGKLGVDARWESGLTNSQAKFVMDNLGGLTVDTSQQQFILNIYYKFR